MDKSKQLVQEILDLTDIKINGNRPWDVQVHNSALYNRVLKGGSLALGESYMDGWWDVPQLDVFFYLIVKAQLGSKIIRRKDLLVRILLNKLFNMQTITRSIKVANVHYNLGNDLYTAILDKNMVYSCGYWANTDDLNQAQINKLDLCCQKMHLKPGMKVLDIGCGWGSFAKYAAENYGVSVVGLTISKEQAVLAKKRTAHLPVEILLTDYREYTPKEKFDAIVSIGMFEHVGRKNYKTYFTHARRLLVDEGIFVLHTIGYNEHRNNPYDPWVNKYIFPGGELSGIAQIFKASERYFIMEDMQNFGAYYDITLGAWFNNFQASWPMLQAQYGERFYRMWSYYLQMCMGLFRARNVQLFQIVFIPNGLNGVYQRFEKKFT